MITTGLVGDGGKFAKDFDAAEPIGSSTKPMIHYAQAFRHISYDALSLRS
jgi:hypothetical protein